MFKPRKALTEHLQKLVESGVIRGVEQAEDFAEIMDGARQPTHGVVYVAHDKSQNFSAQGKSSIKQTEVYTVILAWRNNRPTRSNHSHGMDEAGEVKDAIDWHIHGWLPAGQYRSKSTGKPFIITDSPETFYRPGGWAFYPMAFAIDITRQRPRTP
ncbi:MAG: hypothetical protein CR977_02510 [Gammaproteobacteria bacterium]|nr:MAG: hypothetical protein CR977_02510 [Gammaproteobacteria bacterium]